MRVLFGYLFVAILLFAGCSPSQAAHDESLIDRLEHEAVHSEPADINIEHLLLELKTVPVEADSADPFQTLSRTHQIVKYPCTACHETSFEAARLADATGVEPHWDIKLKHAGPSVMTCTTCHQSDNPDSLHTLTGVSVEFDNSYQTCAQCHSSEFDDWVGGAHGKPVGGWAPPRVVETCTGCHNPHDPAWDVRWPAVTGGGSQE
ncbi:MAG: hypothetical protein ACI9EW_003169 [Cellvibrionaceae bacterium]|jgi:hypothetical protein